MAEASNSRKIVFQNSDNKILYDFLVEQLGGINERFDGVVKRFDAHDKSFGLIEKQIVELRKEHVADYKQLAELMMEQFEKVYDKFDEFDRKKADKSDIDMILSRLAQTNDKIDDMRADQIGLKRQVDKHEKWHLQTAAKVGLELK